MMQRAQAAMEYLMTYGWAILVIAVVLAILFSLGVFSGSPLLGTSCLAGAGYVCSQPILYTNGNLAVTLGESLGQPITLTGIACTPTANAPSTFQSAGSVQLSSGGTTSVTFSCPLGSDTIGSSFSGYLWAQYNLGSQSGAVSKVGSVTAVASTPAGGGASAPQASFVQAASSHTTGNSATCTFGSDVKSGDILVAMYNEYGSNQGTSVPSVSSDTESLTWTTALANSYLSQIFRNTVFYATATSSGSESITTSSGSTIYDSMLVCYEISGASASGVMTVGAGGNGGAPATANVPQISPSQGAIVLGSVSWNDNSNPSATSDTGYTLYPSSPQASYGSITEYYSNWPGGSTGVAFNFGNLNTFWYESAIAFQHS